jgi:hypothetical protein
MSEGRRQRHELSGGDEQARNQREVENEVGRPQRRRPGEDGEDDRASDDGNDGPAVRPCEGEERPCGDKEQRDNAGRPRPPRRSNSCTGARNNANSSTCFARSRPC